MFHYALTQKQLSELRYEHKLCHKRREADKIKAVYLLGSDWSISQVCEALLLEDDAVRRYFHRYKEGGLPLLLQTDHVGKGFQLTEQELHLLDTHLTEDTYKSIGEIIHYVDTEFDVHYSESGMRFVLKTLNFCYKKPEKIPYKVDVFAQKRFVKHYEKLKKTIGSGDGIYFMDATHPEHTVVPAYGWMKRGEVKVVKSNPRPYRLNINGAINISSLDMIVRFEKKIDKESTKDFLEALRDHQPKGCIYLFCDNAGYYQSLEVQAYAKSMAIELVYLPAYAPNLNLVERVWKFFKKKVLYNKYYDEFSDMWNSCETFFRNIGQYHDELKTLMTEKFQIITG